MTYRKLPFSGVLLALMLAACSQPELDPVLAPTLPPIPTDPPLPAVEASAEVQAVAENPAAEQAVAEQAIAADESAPAEQAAPALVLPEGFPERPAAVDEYFRSDKPEFIAATGRPQLLEFFTFW